MSQPIVVLQSLFVILTMLVLGGVIVHIVEKAVREALDITRIHWERMDRIDVRLAAIEAKLADHPDQ